VVHCDNNNEDDEEEESVVEVLDGGKEVVVVGSSSAESRLSPEQLDARVQHRKRGGRGSLGRVPVWPDQIAAAATSNSCSTQAGIQSHRICYFTISAMQCFGS
jgi:hypothetical protein